MDPLAALTSLGDATRRRVYEHVAAQARPVTRDDAAQGAGIGRTLAAYHLDRLAAEGLLEVTYARRSGRSGPGAGRPAKLYARAPQEVSVNVPPRDYPLAARLLADAAADDPGGHVRRSLTAAAERLGHEIAQEAVVAGAAERRPPEAAGAGAAERRPAEAAGAERRPAEAGAAERRPAEAGAAERRPADARPVLESLLRERGYEPYDDNGVVRLRNCPFHAVAQRQPELICDMNLALLRGLADGLDGSGLTARLEPGPGRCCVALHRDWTERSAPS